MPTTTRNTGAEVPGILMPWVDSTAEALKKARSNEQTFFSEVTGGDPLRAAPLALALQGYPPREISAARGHGSALRFHAHDNSEHRG